MAEQTIEPFASWAIVEMMGHLRLAGYATETTIAGAGFVRVDVPGPDGEMRPKYCAPGSIYAITPCDEETARNIANPPRYVPGRFAELEAAETYHGDIDDDFDEDIDGQDSDEDEGDGE